jgi:hypothetical protein
MELEGNKIMQMPRWEFLKPDGHRACDG